MAGTIARGIHNFKEYIYILLFYIRIYIPGSHLVGRCDQLDASLSGFCLMVDRPKDCDVVILARGEARSKGLDQQELLEPTEESLEARLLHGFLSLVNRRQEALQWLTNVSFTRTGG